MIEIGDKVKVVKAPGGRDIRKNDVVGEVIGVLADGSIIVQYVFKFEQFTSTFEVEEIELCD